MAARDVEEDPTTTATTANASLHLLLSCSPAAPSHVAPMPSPLQVSASRSTGATGATATAAASTAAKQAAAEVKVQAVAAIAAQAAAAVAAQAATIMAAQAAEAQRDSANRVRQRYVAPACNLWG